MAKLSVNVNKIATLRNSRGADMPNVLKVALDCEKFGAEGITVHPRPDGRHIKYSDVRELKQHIKTELNIEGYPNEEFIELVLEVVPAQVTLVPDPPEAITSNAGWNVNLHKDFLTKTIKQFHAKGIRVSIFVEPNASDVIAAKETGTDRVELYTETYAKNYTSNPAKAAEPFIKAAMAAKEIGIGVNAGHDLSLENLKYLNDNIDNLLEVSIGHALVCDALYLGLQNTVQLYLRQLKK